MNYLRKMWSHIEVQVLATLTLFVGVRSNCREVNWVHSLDSGGLSECDISNPIISGFYRSEIDYSDDGIGRLENAECCSLPNPWQVFFDFVIANWWVSLDHENTWNVCPAGYFLSGLYGTGISLGSKLSNIEEGRCIKAVHHPDRYGYCYDLDTSVCFSKQGWCRCYADSFMTGLYRGGCNELHCITKMRCCTFAAVS